MLSATYPSLQNRSVFITGGGTGIGEALVRAFAGQGAKVTFVDIAVEASEILAAELSQAGRSVTFAECNITDVDALKKIIDSIGPVDVLVNNAASDDRHDWREVDAAYWDQRFAINLRPQFFAIQAVAPAMVERKRGSIINFGSVSWMLRLTGMPAYTAAKAAVQGLTRCFARELGPHGVRVNTIVPGAVMTKRQLDLWITPETEREIQANQCIPARLMPDQIAAMALFLGADDSAMCTGQDFIVDAGWT